MLWTTLHVFKTNIKSWYLKSLFSWLFCCEFYITMWFLWVFWSPFSMCSLFSLQKDPKDRLSAQELMVCIISRICTYTIHNSISYALYLIELPETSFHQHVWWLGCGSFSLLLQCRISTCNLIKVGILNLSESFFFCSLFTHLSGVLECRLLNKSIVLICKGYRWLCFGPHVFQLKWGNLMKYCPMLLIWLPEFQLMRFALLQPASDTKISE